jgi:DNA-binding transcriptional regulator YhcF (GntR family)
MSPPLNIFQFIYFDEYSITPKYLQLTDCILKAIEEGKIGKDYLLPSINDLSYELEIGRNTAEKAYNHLKKKGIVGSVPGKGFFIMQSEFKQTIKVCLIFNKLSAHKKIIYDSIADALIKHGSIDLYIYNNDFNFFKKLLQSKGEGYTHYVVIPHFLEGAENAYKIIDTIDKDKLILLDKFLEGVTGEFGAVYENFEKDIYNALREALPRLSSYHTIKLIFPGESYYPKEIVKGFQTFCDEYAFSHKIVNQINQEPIEGGEVYINLMEDDLVKLIEKIMEKRLVVGRDVGVISYNETPLKKIILNGITTISTDFKMMGEQAAQLILSKSKEHIEIPFRLTLRPSL